MTKVPRDQLERLVKYVQSGGLIQSHEDVPGMIREQLYRAERQRLNRPRHHSRPVPESSGIPPSKPSVSIGQDSFDVRPEAARTETVGVYWG